MRRWTTSARARSLVKYLQLCIASAKAARAGAVLRAKTIGMAARRLHRLIWG